MRRFLLVPCVGLLPFSIVMSQNDPAPSRISEQLPTHVIKAPHPEYPYDARRQHLSGLGILSFHVDYATGRVISAEMLESTGSDMLDKAALRAAKEWRFDPRSIYGN